MESESSIPSGDILLKKELGARQLIKFYQGQYKEEEALLIGGEALQLWPLLADGLTDIERIKALRHPNLLELKAFYPSARDEYVVKDDRVFFVHRWEDGMFLSNYLKEERALDVPTALGVFMQMLAAVSFLHAQGFSHGFLSPASFIIRRKGVAFGAREGAGLEVFLADYPAESIIKCELAKSGADLPYRSVLFASPEVISRGEVRKEADYFSLGAMLFYMLTGVHPFSDSFGRPSMKDLLSGSAAPFDQYSARVPSGVRALIERLIATDPKARLCDPDEIRGAAKILMAQAESAPARMIAPPRGLRFPGAAERIFWISFATLLIAGGFIAWTLFRLLYVPSGQLRVPDLIGKDAVEARGIVGALGLRIEEIGEDFSTTVPKG
ncbi:MAG: serine/threonine protein kinase, partial [bacterium]